MQSYEISNQSIRIFGPGGQWRCLDEDTIGVLNLPNHLSDQVFRIMFLKKPALHLFEITVSEQCPKDAYARISKCLARLRANAVVINFIHNRSANAHLVMWQETRPERHFHLDLDFAHISEFDRELMAHIAHGGPAKLNHLFALIQGRDQGDSFFRTLRSCLKKLNCDNQESWHGVVDLALKLVFLIFVQRKGWLNFDPFYLEGKMNYCHGRGLSIVQCLFKPLFARLEGERVQEIFPLGNLPTLGGGLFRFDPLCLPRITNQWCLNLFQTLVSQHSFSLFEGREDRNVLGVGPEMLGYVFENLLFREDRKNHGIFFTPQHVAERQVHAAFQAWVRTNGLAQGSPGLNRALQDIRILDPSCGSGTYLVAAYRVLLEQRLSLAPKHERYNGKLFLLKRSIMLENLYGIDINPIAVRLTEVRLWLNMIQDLEIPEPSKAPSLPNLQHHLRPGDFLGRHVPGKSDQMRYWSKYPLLEGMRKRFPLSSPVGRPQLLKHIYRLEGELCQWLENCNLRMLGQAEKERLSQTSLPGQEKKMAAPVLPRDNRSGMPIHVIFSRVFLEGGFDLILGNPPWLSATQLSKEHKLAIQRNFSPPVGLKLMGQVDLSLYFLGSALNLLRPGGHLGFLMPGKLLQARYAASVRTWLRHHSRIDYLFDYGLEHKFLFKADTFPLAIGVSKTLPCDEHRVLIEKRDRHRFLSFLISQNRLAAANNVWSLSSPEELALLNQTAWWPVLRDFPVTIKRGIITNDKHTFVFDQKPEFLPEYRVRPLLRGRDIQAGQVKPGTLLYWPFDDGDQWFAHSGPAEKDWLRGSDRCYIQGNTARLSYRPRQLSGWILVWKYLAKDWKPALYRQPWIPDQTTYYMPFQSFETAWRFFAYFNTDLARGWLNKMAERGKDQCRFYYAHTCRDLPVPPDLMLQPIKIPEPKDLYLADEAPGWDFGTHLHRKN